jgi:hypothetical protein
MRTGLGEEYPEFFRAKGYAIEALERCEENLRRGLDATLVASGP